MTSGINPVGHKFYLKNCAVLRRVDVLHAGVVGEHQHEDVARVRSGKYRSSLCKYCLSDIFELSEPLKT